MKVNIDGQEVCFEMDSRSQIVMLCDKPASSAAVYILQILMCKSAVYKCPVSRTKCVSSVRSNF